MAIIAGLQTQFSKIRPEEIISYLRSDISPRSDFIADVVSLDKARGDTNNTPREPSTIGVKGLIDASTVWTARTDSPVSRYYSSSAAQTSNTQVVFGGSGSNTNYKFTDSSNNWSAKLSMPTANRTTQAASVLDSDRCLAIGGSNNGESSYLGSTDRFNDAANTWTGRTARSSLSGYATAGSLTSDTSLCAGGYNNVNPYYTSNNDLFTESTGNWTSKAAMGTANATCGGGALTSDITVLIGGDNNQIQRYTLSLNSWINRNTLIMQYALSGAAVHTSDLLSTFGGQNTSIRLNFTLRYADSTNSQTYRSNMYRYSNGDGRYTAVSSFSSSNSLIVGGYNSAYNYYNSRYTDNAVNIYSNTDIVSNQPNNTPAVPDTTGTQQVYTKKLLSTIPSKIIVNILKRKQPTTNDTTVDISSDGGNTWGITGKSVNTVISCNGLYGNDFRLRFNLAREARANTWTNLNNINITRSYRNGASLTSDLSLMIGGYNSAGNPTTPNERFSNILNSWTTRTTLDGFRYSPGVLSLNSDLTLTAAGANASGYHTTSVRSSDSSNSYISRQGVAIPRQEAQSNISLTSDGGMIVGGYNGVTGGLNNNDKYSDALNTMTVKAVCSNYTYGCAGASLTTDTGIVSTYYAYSVSNILKYTFSGDSWSARANNVTSTYPRYAATLSGLNSDLLITTGGDASAYNSQSVRFSDSSNSWLIRSNMNTGRYGHGNASQTSNNCIVFGGNPTIVSTERYNDGETFFKGFGMKYL